jgi:hypothetical protein
MAQGDVLQRNGGGATEKGAEEGPDTRTRIIAAPNVRDEGLAEILHQAFERRVFDRDRLRTEPTDAGGLPPPGFST